jgi:phosphoribosylformylglycinamidine (FGAM) synthase PurS component
MKKVLLPVLFASAGLMLLTGCKDSPATVTKKYVKACQNGDTNAAFKCVSGKDIKRDARREAESGQNIKAIKNAKFSNPVIEDDTATVDMTYEVTTKVELEKVNGEWKVKKADFKF